MPLTTTQTQVMASHLAALRHSFRPDGPPDKTAKFTPTDVLASMVLELGPAIIPLMCDCICCNPIDVTQIHSGKINEICVLCDECICELENCIGEEVPPGRIFQGLIAKLLKEMWPMIVKIFMDFLKERDTTKQTPFKI